MSVKGVRCILAMSQRGKRPTSGLAEQNHKAALLTFSFLTLIFRGTGTYVLLKENTNTNHQD